MFYMFSFPIDFKQNKIGTVVLFTFVPLKPVILSHNRYSRNMCKYKFWWREVSSSKIRKQKQKTENNSYTRTPF